MVYYCLEIITMSLREIKCLSLHHVSVSNLAVFSKEQRYNQSFLLVPPKESGIWEYLQSI